MWGSVHIRQRALLVFLSSVAQMLAPLGRSWAGGLQAAHVCARQAAGLLPLPVLLLPASPLIHGRRRRTAPGVLEKYEHLDKLHPLHGQPATTASASESASAGGEGSTSASGGSSGGGAAEGQPGGAGAGPAAESDMLKTDSPGAGETQHPGEASQALMKQQASAACTLRVASREQ